MSTVADQTRYEERDLIGRAAWLYYVGDRNQEQIAAQLGLSRFKVMRLLSQARDNGVVKFFIEPGTAETATLGEQISSAFGLAECVVTPPLGLDGADGESAARSAVGIAAAAFLSRRLQARDNLTVGLGWGRTVAALVAAFPTMSRPGARFVSLMGSLSRTARTNPFEVVHTLAQSCGGEAYLLPAPFIVDSETDFDVLMNQAVVREALALGASADFCVASFGTCSRDSLASQYGFLGGGEIDELLAAGAAGDLLGKFFDCNGSLVASPLNRRTPSISVETMRNLEFVLLAAGACKRDALRAVLQSGIVDRLIIDGDLARAVT